MFKGPRTQWIILGVGGLIIVYALISSFLPPDRNHLTVVEDQALGEPKLEGSITGMRHAIPMKPEASEDIKVQPPLRDMETPFPIGLDDARSIPFLPENSKPLVLQERAGEKDPGPQKKDIEQKGPIFRSKQDLETKRRLEDQTTPEVTVTHPKSVGWEKKERPFLQPGGVLSGILRSDVVAGSGETLALVEVMGLDTSLGVCLMRASLDGDRIQLEGSEIVGENGAIRGKFSAFGPDGSQGLIGDRRRHVLEHFGIVLYRTALGVLALRVADSGNTLAGLVGANAGTQILEDLAGDQRRERGVPKTVMVPRGFRFQLVALDRAVINGSGSYQEAVTPQFFGKTKAAEQDQSARLQALREYFQSDDGNFQKALNHPEYLLELGDR